MSEREKMEKNVALNRSACGLSKNPSEPKKDNGRGNGNGQSHYGKKREPSLGKGGPDASLQRRPNPQRSKGFTDKRPRSCKEGVGAGRRDEVTKSQRAEFGSALSYGPKKMNLTHLINFTMAPRESGEGGAPGGWRGRNKWAQRYPRYNKEQFLQANCQFVVKANCDYALQCVDADKLVDWELIEQVRILCQEVPSCPICLYPATAAKITRCGHIYCWTCMLHYLALGEKSWRKCPICYEAVHQKDLKSVVARATRTYGPGDEITFRLMKREKGSVLTQPHSSPECGNLFTIRDDPGTTCMVKLLLASPEQVQEMIIEPERAALLAQLQEENGDLEDSFTESALKMIKEREEGVNVAQKAQSLIPNIVGLNLKAEEAKESVEHTTTLSPPCKNFKHYSSAFDDEEVDQTEVPGNGLQGFDIEEPFPELATPFSPIRAPPVVAPPNASRMGVAGDKGAGHEAGRGSPSTQYKEGGRGSPSPQYQEGGRGSPAPQYQEGGRGSPSPQYQEGGRGSPSPQYQEGGRGSPSPQYQEGGRGSPSPQYQEGGRGSPAPVLQEEEEEHGGAHGASSGGKGHTYFFYQADDGQHLYLHSLNVRCLIREHGAFARCPETITAKIVEVEHMSMNESLRRRLHYLYHLPLTCEFGICELELKQPLVSKATLQNFASEIQQRKKAREKRMRNEKRQERKMQIKENRKTGKHPPLKFSLQSSSQFPSFGSGAAPQPEFPSRPRALESSPGVAFPDSPVSSTLGSPESLSQEDGAAGHAGQWHGIRGGDRALDMDSPGGPSPVIGSWASAASNDEHTLSGPSFAQMLREGKAKPESSSPWPKVGKPAGAVQSTDVGKREARHRKTSAQGPDGSDESSSEDFAPVPQYRDAFSDAIQAALDKAAVEATLHKMEDGSTTSPGLGKRGKKGKKKQQLLFSTAGPRFK